MHSSSVPHRWIKKEAEQMTKFFDSEMKQQLQVSRDRDAALQHAAQSEYQAMVQRQQALTSQRLAAEDQYRTHYLQSQQMLSMWAARPARNRSSTFPLPAAATDQRSTLHHRINTLPTTSWTSASHRHPRRSRRAGRSRQKRPGQSEFQCLA